MTSTLYPMTLVLNTFMLRSVSGALVGDAPNDAYVKWRTERGDALFAHTKFLSKSGATSPDDDALPSGGDGATRDEPLIALHWSINQDSKKIHLAVAVEAKGWVGVGFTEMSGMRGADMVVYEGASNRLYDAFSVAYERPQIDVQQDWTLIESVTNDGVLIFEAERLLDTGDNMDRPLVDDTSLVEQGTRVVAAWGDAEQMTYHGADRRLQASVRFFADPSVSMSDRALFESAMADEAEGYVTLRMTNWPISSRRGFQYASKCWTTADLIRRQGLPDDRPVHLIGYDFDLDPGDYVHHMVVFSDTRDNLPCDTSNGAGSFMHTWNLGQSRTFSYPKAFGLLLADESDAAGTMGIPPKSFRLEIHYENPNKIRGLRDSSGVRLYYTTKLREHRGDILDLADGRLHLMGQKIGSGVRRHTFRCPASCTERHLPPQGVTVFYELFHMHYKGLTMEIVHRRNGQEVHKAGVEYYDARSGGQVVQRNYTILPGDAIETRCTYDGDDGLRFGASLQDEMCLGQILYYPASTHIFCAVQSDVDECVSDHTAVTLSGKDSLERTFGVASSRGIGSSALSAKNSEGNQEGAMKELQAFTHNETAILASFSFVVIFLVCFFYRKRGSRHEGYKQVAFGVDMSDFGSGEMLS